MSNELIREAAERNRGAVLPQKHFKLVPGTAHLNQPEMTTFTLHRTGDLLWDSWSREVPLDAFCLKG